MALPIYRYPLDKTGENPDNYVNSEPHSLTPMARPTDVRVLAPIYGPFFTESVIVRDLANGIVLVKNADYRVTDLLQDPTLSFGKEIGQFIVIMNGNVSNQVSVSYQVLGGNYQNDATSIQHVFETFLNDTRPVDWNDISGKPSTFPPSLHIHLLNDIVGWGPVIVALDSLRDAILLNNTPMYEALIDWVNTRKTPWANIVGSPTTAGELGLTDVVFKTRRINTLSTSGLKGGGTLNTDLTLSLTDTGVIQGTYGSATSSAVVNVDRQGRLLTVEDVLIKPSWVNVTDRPTTVATSGLSDAVATSRTIATPAIGGLIGGGNLQSNLSLSLSNTNVVAGTYGTFNKIPVVTVDVKGRITRMAVVDPVIEWSTLTNRPTTVATSGLTDAVATSRRINTSVGIIGGGPLTSDLNLRLDNTGVVAGDYGSGSAMTTFTVDQQGRLTRAGTVSLNLSWGNITNKPTTIGGYGITDAVTSNTNQTVTGTKTFNKSISAWGSTAANIDDGNQSRIVSEDYLRRYVASQLNSGGGDQAVLRFGNLVIQAGYLHLAPNAVWTVGWGVGNLPIPYRRVCSNTGQFIAAGRMAGSSMVAPMITNSNDGEFGNSLSYYNLYVEGSQIVFGGYTFSSGGVYQISGGQYGRDFYYYFAGWV